MDVVLYVQHTFISDVVNKFLFFSLNLNILKEFQDLNNIR